MQSDFLSNAGLARLAADFEDIFRELPEERQKMFEQIGQAVLDKVRGRIGGSGKVKSWQGAFVGSGGGYAAVRAVADTFYDGYAVGYITNAIENQHRQEKGRYIPAIGKTLVRDAVPGKHMYVNTMFEANQIGYAAAERFAAELKERLGR